jgi:hypothetical protein
VLCWQGALPLFLLWIFLLINLTPERFFRMLLEGKYTQISGMLDFLSVMESQLSFVSWLG